MTRLIAGARKDKDLQELDAIENVQAVRLDVTRADEIAAAVATITQGGRGLYALVNNAGVAIRGPLVDTREEDFHYVMDVNVYDDTLAAEMAPLGVRVSLVEPGNYRSEISRTAALCAGADASKADRSQYTEPHDVAAAVLHPLTAANPRPRYIMVPVQAEAELTIRKAIEELVQLNAAQPFSYDRRQLVEMLDAALGAAPR